MHVILAILTDVAAVHPVQSVQSNYRNQICRGKGPHLFLTDVVLMAHIDLQIQLVGTHCSSELQSFAGASHHDVLFFFIRGLPDLAANNEGRPQAPGLSWLFPGASFLGFLNRLLGS